MTDTERRKAAKNFAEYWKDRGDEKSMTESTCVSELMKMYQKLTK